MAKVAIKQTPVLKTQDTTGGANGKQKTDRDEGQNLDVRVRKSGVDRDERGD